ncbi:penicillin-insensitive murein endopeptidase [Hyalangium minutum]|uniref:LysM domain protein n=1 Tax=Hyalangium minutum TaxID=394096 RepID=A0A085WIX6_9BACT|nr:penicillin-insensitive murein endopeptidase [Hyalangium minutum]KFE67639.1 LysM domain protein [Hyalangium minutum]
MPPSQPLASSAAMPGAATEAVSAPTASTAVAESPEAAPEGEDAAEGEADDDSDSAEVAGFESTESDESEGPEASPGSPEVQYTTDISDTELERRWKEEPATLGSVSVGFVHSGRMVNALRFPDSKDWTVVSPEKAWTTQETVDYLTQVIRELRARYPDAPLLRVNQISAKDGGYIRPHKSHQNGRDVDLGFYYPNGNVVRTRARENSIDLVMNWALIRALVTHADVQLILVDRRVQKVLYDHALKIGEDKAWLDSLFHAGEQSIIKHARGHRDHFHVRFYNPRAQELGRRLAPLLALQPEHNIAMHRVRSGDTLGAIAIKYNSTVQGLRNANRIRGSMLHIGQVLSVPLRGPCTRCPVPPPVVVPPRRLPVDAMIQAQAQSQAVPAPAPETGAEPALKAEAPPEVKAAGEEKPAPEATASDAPGT